MAKDHTGRAKHQRTGRVPPHGPGERVIESTTATDREPEARSLRGDPPAEYKREQADDVPGVKKKSR